MSTSVIRFIMKIVSIKNLLGSDVLKAIALIIIEIDDFLVLLVGIRLHLSRGR